MTLLLGSFWPGLAGAALLGLSVGWLAGRPARPLVPLALGGLAVLVAAAAVSGLVPGLPGLWLEGAALILPPYLAACELGVLARRSFASSEPMRPDLDPPPRQISGLPAVNSSLARAGQARPASVEGSPPSGLGAGSAVSGQGAPDPR